MNLFNKIFKNENTKPNPYGLVLNNLKTKGNSYVIPDLHGCLNTFKQLLSQINFTKRDHLFILGDLIDRGKHSVELVDFIIELKGEFNIYAIRGNHEEELILMEKYGKKNLIETNIKSNNLVKLYDSNLQLKEKYLNFFNSLPYYIELKEHILVHAGFDFENPHPYSDTISMLEIRNWPYDVKKAKNKTIVHGHNITAINDIRKAVISKNKILPLDNGCFATNIENIGNLTCLCIDTLELFVLQNIEEQ